MRRAAVLNSPIKALIILAAAAALGLPACGIRNEPRPPELTMPVRPDGFSVSIEKEEVRLKWNRPKTSVDGERLYDLAGFVIERRTDETEYAVLAEIRVVDRDRVRPQTSFKWRDLDPLEGRSFYRVRAFTEDGQTGSISPGAPVEVTQEIVEHAAQLRSAASTETQEQ
jgi:hypothetical protein